MQTPQIVKTFSTWRRAERSSNGLSLLASTSRGREETLVRPCLLRRTAARGVVTLCGSLAFVLPALSYEAPILAERWLSVTGATGREIASLHPTSHMATPDANVAACDVPDLAYSYGWRKRSCLRRSRPRIWLRLTQTYQSARCQKPVAPAL